MKSVALYSAGIAAAYKGEMLEQLHLDLLAGSDYKIRRMAPNFYLAR